MVNMVKGADPCIELMGYNTPGQAIISYGPRNFSESFLEGLVIRKNCALTNVWLPILNSGARLRWESAKC